MDIRVINETIEQLQQAETTPDNVDELSKLYIVRDHLFSSEQSHNFNIIPCYSTYIDRKRQYQLHQTDEEPVIASIKDVCHDIEDFLSILYSNSDTRKERKHIRDCIERLNNKYCK